MTDITKLAQREKFEVWFKSSFHPDKTGPYIKDQLYFAWKAAGAELVEALEKAHQRIASQREYYEGVIADGGNRIAELESRLESADKLQDSAFRSGLQHGFSLGQTDDQKGYEQSMAAYSLAAGIKVEAE
ncbi:ead/Ea22-like family protein [Klebsiella quasipneumoniae subsp. similipneumoniae]|uniref:ead/Ea22-like family protein n=1 Tax=Klebsiella quasipneumoniae TaxID=1463165 RepID=UPI001E4D12F0|nr:ead/Ea22-like family protein [Klebsiella quasipneumoniae]MCD6615305.1 ead/Ea22-like family protein [Klebsiella quasipneumoniae subsp. similipneumoniae]